jgi:uncharacterized membrane protein YphA (DoxX/SURF4 family)
MQRFFSTFPGRWPGAGLLLLRGAVGTAAVIEGGILLTRGESPEARTLAVALVAMGAGASLLIGFLTPVAAALVVLGGTAMAQTWLPAPMDNADGILPVFVAAVAAAIVPLGPGAFSVDAYLFGRREIVIRAEPGGRS